ncbi:Solute carrier 2, facilitated glucose transporter member 1 [Diplodia seriata]|uniref:Solute carrier 2, facilitated glucose transporter member 1 n=1 Tax=Diplodia seriata TaxID=420778 RepID=A0ABR3CKE4_9PEZI
MAFLPNFEATPLAPPHSSRLVIALLILSSCISSATLGYDGSMMSGLNILPAYNNYFHLTPATTALNTATVYIGQVIPCFFYGAVSDRLGRKNAMAIAAVATIAAVVLQAAAQNVAMFAVSRILWLVYQNRGEEALYALALTHSDGDQKDAATLVEFQSISDTLKWEKESGEMTVKEIVRTPSRRKRITLTISVAVFSMLSGNNIVSYYLGTMLDGAGVTDTTTQLEINIIMNAWCLCVALLGTYCLNKFGRKTIAIFSTTLLTAFLFLYAGLNKLYGESTNTSGIYASVAIIFLFQGSYSFGWTPLTVLYPPEVLNYSMRANGMAVYTFVVNCVGLFVTMVFPFAMDAIGWKTYIINASWDILEVLYLVFAWVETKGKTLEEIDAIFDGHKHSDVPDVEQILHAGVPGTVIEGVELNRGSMEGVEEVDVSVGKGKEVK